MVFNDILGNNITFVRHWGKCIDVDQAGTRFLTVLHKGGPWERRLKGQVGLF